jgi:hypothetical protein
MEGRAPRILASACSRVGIGKTRPRPNTGAAVFAFPAKPESRLRRPGVRRGGGGYCRLWPVPSAGLWGLAGVVAVVGGAGAAAPRAARAAGLVTIQLEADRKHLLANGKDFVTITAKVYDVGGRAVRDGIVVRFATTAGRFEAGDTAATQNGVARVTLIASELPATANVTASVEGEAAAAPGRLVLTFSADAEAAYEGNNWARVTGAQYVAYAADFGVIQANGRNGGARFTYRNLEVSADALQVNVRSNQLRAAGNVVLTRGGTGAAKRTYTHLRFDFLQGEGVGERDEDGRPVTLLISGPAGQESHSQPLPSGAAAGSSAAPATGPDAAPLSPVAPHRTLPRWSRQLCFRPTLVERRRRRQPPRPRCPPHSRAAVTPATFSLEEIGESRATIVSKGIRAGPEHAHSVSRRHVLPGRLQGADAAVSRDGARPGNAVFRADFRLWAKRRHV